MNSMTVVFLLCLVAAACARHHAEFPAVGGVAALDGQVAPESEYYPEERTLRNKRSLLLLKKKLLLGAIGLKAAKVGAVGLGALALKKKFGG